MLLYPYWHQAKTASDRLSPADLTLLRPHLGRAHDADPTPASQAVTIPQPVSGPLTGAAIFIIYTVRPGGEQTVRDLCGDLAGLLRSVGFRDLNGGLSCVVGFGSDFWDRLEPGKVARGTEELRSFFARAMQSGCFGKAAQTQVIEADGVALFVSRWILHVKGAAEGPSPQPQYFASSRMGDGRL